MNSALAAMLGLTLSIILIVKKVSPVYSLILGALIGGLLSGWGLQNTVTEMISGIMEISPAIIRILAAGVLTGMLVKTGAASTISETIIKKLGPKRIYLALALAAMLLTGIGVFIDVAVITIAPIALIAGSRLNLPKSKLLIAMIGGGKCGKRVYPLDEGGRRLCGRYGKGHRRRSPSGRQCVQVAGRCGLGEGSR